MKIEEPYEVGAFPDTKTKREVVLADETGQMNLVLWRQRAQKVSFNTDDVILLENLVTTTFNGKMNLTTSFETTIKVQPGEKIEVVANLETFATKIEMTTAVLAIKNFQYARKCFLCKSTIVQTAVNSVTTDCASCKGSFLSRLATVTNQCLVMLSDNNWYTATQSVILSLLNWTEPKPQLDEKDKVLLLTSKYTLEIDPNRNIIESAIQYEDSEMPKDDLETLDIN
ncbi:uncharacterized protein LOC114538104 [Dendronephthya gigantea]|uniref:uncharacterized protein LOC114538104 n=1 Tax=Dendronephthya gigantea TaxID=151771 RepID=UPI00106D5C0E|nr:uncharacterized protein LOC114538104 [Dendronephthya gigantea]